MSIGHQNDILVHNRRDHLSQGICVDRGQNRTDCRAAAISDSQYRNLFIRQAPLAGLASPASRLALKVSCTFPAFRHTGFIGFHNARELACLQVFCGRKSVPPTEGGVDGKSATFC